MIDKLAPILLIIGIILGVLSLVLLAIVITTAVVHRSSSKTKNAIVNENIKKLIETNKKNDN